MGEGYREFPTSDDGCVDGGLLRGDEGLLGEERCALGFSEGEIEGRGLVTPVECWGMKLILSKPGEPEEKEKFWLQP